MEHSQDWLKRVAAQVGKRVAYFRSRTTDGRGRKMTAQALADRCGDLGLPLGRPTIAKLEKGLRESVTIAEVSVLAKALQVAPVDLIFPLGQNATVEVLPGQHVDTWEAVRWFSGFAARPALPSEDYTGAVELYQLHDVILQEFRGGQWAGPSAERMGVTALRSVRPAMRERGLLLPDLPPELAYVDNGDAG